ncbi:MAG: dephospho-CoA kinase [Nanoarchaeales archaeon]|nr:dephospho-CoA kinase [Nanoarchaeales archaeon]
MIIAISGSVGSGKTTIAKTLSEKLDYKLINLNELAKEYKIEDVQKLQTFDFDLDKLLDDLELKLKNKEFGDNAILEGHFAHFINPELISRLIIIGKDLKQLKQIYKDRKYNEQKIKDNLEVESFNLCFYESLEEGYKEGKQVFLVENNETIQDTIDKIKILLI